MAKKKSIWDQVGDYQEAYPQDTHEGVKHAISRPPAKPKKKKKKKRGLLGWAQDAMGGRDAAIQDAVGRAKRRPYRKKD